MKNIGDVLRTELNGYKTTFDKKFKILKTLMYFQKRKHTSSVCVKRIAFLALNIKHSFERCTRHEGKCDRIPWFHFNIKMRECCI